MQMPFHLPAADCCLEDVQLMETNKWYLVETVHLLSCTCLFVNWCKCIKRKFGLNSNALGTGLHYSTYQVFTRTESKWRLLHKVADSDHASVYLLSIWKRVKRLRFSQLLTHKLLHYVSFTRSSIASCCAHQCVASLVGQGTSHWMKVVYLNNEPTNYADSAGSSILGHRIV